MKGDSDKERRVQDKKSCNGRAGSRLFGPRKSRSTLPEKNHTRPMSVWYNGRRFRREGVVPAGPGNLTDLAIVESLGRS